MNLLQVFIENFALLMVGVASFAIGLLGLFVFISDKKSTTNQTFFLLSLIAISYAITNYMSSLFMDRDLTLILLRLTIFSATWYAFTLFHFFYVFPNNDSRLPAVYKYALVPVVVATSILTLTPLVFSGIKHLASRPGEVSEAELGPAMALFGLVSMGLVIASIVLLFKKTFRATGIEKKQLQLILTGTIISYALIIIFNLIFPVALQNTRFIPLVPIFLFPSIAFTAYAIIKRQLFNVKVIATELLVFVIWIIVFTELLTRESLGERITEGTIFLLTIIFGILLIRSVRKEVSRREEFELLSKELTAANEKLKELDDLKTDFISIASHQLRTPLTAIKGYSSMILEGVYGESSTQIRGVIDKIFQSAQRLIYIVNDLLDTSRIEQGKFQLSAERVEIGNVLMDAVGELKPTAANKNIELSLEISPDDADIVINGDQSKLRQVAINLIDNAIKYTEKGYVKVALRKIPGDHLLISVKDTGAGISSQSIKNLFQKFSRAKNAAKLHVDGSGLGLYIAKQIIDAHNGRIWAESDGENKGSQFYVELPMNNTSSTNNIQDTH